MQGVVEVYRARSALQATLLIQALAKVGIEARIDGQFSHSAAESIGRMSWEYAPRILVRAEDAEDARHVLLGLEELERRRMAQDEHCTTVVAVVCEECQQEATFPETQHGSVQDCPHCGAYVDVGDVEGPDVLEEDHHQPE
jgi:hypothetical protein